MTTSDLAPLSKGLAMPNSQIQTTQEEEPVTYSLEELQGFKEGLDRFFSALPDPSHETSFTFHKSGWVARVKLAEPLPAITEDLMAVAQISDSSFILQLVNQLVELMKPVDRFKAGDSLDKARSRLRDLERNEPS